MSDVVKPLDFSDISTLVDSGRPLGELMPAIEFMLEISHPRQIMGELRRPTTRIPEIREATMRHALAKIILHTCV